MIIALLMAVLAHLTPDVLADLTTQSPLMNGSVPKIVWNPAGLTLTNTDTADSYLDRYFDFARYEAPLLTTDIVCIGDSLTMNGLNTTQLASSYPSLLEALVAPSVRVANLGVGGEHSAQILARIQADTQHRQAIHVLCMGRNGSGTGTNWDDTARTALKSHIASAISEIESTPKRYLVLSIPNGNYASEAVGQTRHSNLLLLEAELAALYPDNWLNLRVLVAAEADPETEQTDLTNDWPPAHLRDGVAETVHLNADGRAFWAAQVHAWLLAKGWID